MGPRKGSKKQPPARGGGGGNELLGSPGDSDAENAEWSQQTEQEKRKVSEFNLKGCQLPILCTTPLQHLQKGEEESEGAL